MDLDKGSSPPSSSAALAEAVVAREAVQSDGSAEFFINYLGWLGYLVPLKSAKVLAFGADEIARRCSFWCHGVYGLHNAGAR